MPKVISQSDMEKLPYCKFSDLARCTKDGFPNIDLKHCVMCLYEGVVECLRHEDIAGATHCLITMMLVLKEMDAIPKDAKP